MRNDFFPVVIGKIHTLSKLQRVLPASVKPIFCCSCVKLIISWTVSLKQLTRVVFSPWSQLAQDEWDEFRLKRPNNGNIQNSIVVKNGGHMCSVATNIRCQISARRFFSAWSGNVNFMVFAIEKYWTSKNKPCFFIWQTCNLLQSLFYIEEFEKNIDYVSFLILLKRGTQNFRFLKWEKVQKCCHFRKFDSFAFRIVFLSTYHHLSRNDKYNALPFWGFFHVRRNFVPIL